MDRADIAIALAEAAHQPWAIQPERLDLVAGLIRDFTLGNEVADYRLARFAGVSDLGARAPVHAGNTQIISGRDGQSVAVVSVKGTALYGLELQPFAFSTRLLAHTMQELAADDTVSSIILDIASPGGTVVGVPEAAAAIFAARSSKRVIAAVSPLAASAAYWLASQADEIIVTPSGDLGSIGVYMLHMDVSEAMKTAGVTATFIKAGRFKTEANSFEALGAEARAALQSDVDDVYEWFIKDVARGRDVHPSTVRAGFGEGRVVSAQKALRLGMADQVGTLDRAMSLALPRPGGRRVGANFGKAAPAASTLEVRRRKQKKLAHGNSPTVSLRRRRLNLLRY